MLCNCFVEHVFTCCSLCLLVVCVAFSLSVLRFFLCRLYMFLFFFFFFSSRRRHTRYIGDWSSDVCSSDLCGGRRLPQRPAHLGRRLRSRSWPQAAVAEGPRRLAAAHHGTRNRRRGAGIRSEERRVGKECRSRCAAED